MLNRIFLYFVISVLYARLSYSCEPPKSPKEELIKYDTVFTGKVNNIASLPDSNISVTFNVYKVIKVIIYLLLQLRPIEVVADIYFI